MKKRITENMVVDHVIKNWEELMPNKLFFFKKEHSWLDNWRVDISAWRWTTFISNLSGQEHPFKKPFFIEVKFRSDSRDLIYEFEKGLVLRDRISTPMAFALLSDDISDPAILNFMIKQKIHWFQIYMKGDDLSTMTIQFHNYKKLKNLKGTLIIKK